MKRFRVLKAVAAAATAFAFYTAAQTNAAEPVKIGIIWPLTGNAAAAGQASKAAAEVAADIVNNPHPELGDLPSRQDSRLAKHGRSQGCELVFRRSSR